MCFNPLNAELNPICHLLALLGAHHILHVSRRRVNVLSGIGFGDRHFQLLPPFDMSGINNMSIFHKDECVFMTEWVFVAIVEKRSFIFFKKLFYPS